MKRLLLLLIFCLVPCVLCTVFAQSPVPVGGGSYASFVPLAESASSEHGGCQAYRMEHRPIYAVDSLLARPLPSNDWWTYALISPWTGNLWAYPTLVWADASGVSVAKPSYWEPTGCEMKWDNQVLLSANAISGAPIAFSEKRLSDWSDFMIRFVMEQEGAKVEVTVMRGSPLVWLEYTGCTPVITNPDAASYAVVQQTVGNKTIVAVGVLTDGLTATDLAPYACRIPRHTRFDYTYNAAAAALTTTFHIDYEDFVPTAASGILMGFLPHHYYNTTSDVSKWYRVNSQIVNYAVPRGTLRLARGNDFAFTYTVHNMLPFFPLPDDSLTGYSRDRMQALCQQYAQAGSFGADTYWGGKGLTQMMHYMTAALQLGDTVTYRLAKQRLKETLVNWYTYRPGESQYYFAYYPRWKALVGFDPSYDSDTFNDHHFHYGYFTYASAVLCMLDPDFREQYGPMARELARDYANWLRQDLPSPSGEGPGVRHPSPSGEGSGVRLPFFRMFDPYCGHSYAGGMGNQGNGNGQESSSEAMQSWGGIWMLGAALGDEEMLAAGVMGYTLEARATAEYWFDRNRRNIDFSKYNHPYCCNLTMQGVGWWTWFSGDPVWMHSIQWLPISPVLQNYLSEDRNFARWDYTQMYATKEVGNYEAATGGLGDESGLGNVCLSYLALFDPDSAARVWDRMDQTGKALAKNADTGGITYMLTHGLRQYGPQCHTILSDYPLSAAYVDSLSGDTTYAIFNATNTPITVRFFERQQSLVSLPSLPPHALTIYRSGSAITTIPAITDDSTTVPQDSIAAAWSHAYPNIALHKPVTVSSYENAGCVAVNLTDGDLSTRWGSAHRDNEWARIDLGAQYYVDHIILRWEAAYASSFRLEISADGQNWAGVTYTGSGGVDSRTFAADLLQQGNSPRGRYLRITGLSRATIYGTSLYELEAYGLPLVGNTNEVIALEILSDDISLVPGQTPQYSVHGYNYLGQELPVTPTINHQSSINQYEVTATYGALKAVYEWPILEQVKVVSASVQPREVTIPLGEQQVFTISTLDQFGYTSESTTETYTASELGDHQQIYSLGGFTDTAFIHVVGYADMNLALGKQATCSGTENEAVNGASKAVDGLLDTRWSSRFQDGEWLMVDLGDNYNVNRMKLYWENAYATQYKILLSEDKITWTEAYAKTGSTGGIQDIALSETPARYVKILCEARNTGYGSSLWEIEVYGSGRVNPPTTALHNPQSETMHDEPHYILRNDQLFILRNGHLYSPSGTLVH